MSLQFNQLLKEISHRISFEALTVGDHIYTVNGHGTFTHHGIVVGKGNDVRSTDVIEFNVPRDQSLPQVVTFDVLLRPDVLLEMMATARIQKVSLQSFVAIPPDDSDVHSTEPFVMKPLRRVRYDSPESTRWMARAGANRSSPSLPTERTVQLAYEFLYSGQWPSYDLFLNNCEHFSVFCKTGIAHSAQAERIPAQLRNNFQHKLERINRGGLHSRCATMKVVGRRVSQEGLSDSLSF